MPPFYYLSLVGQSIEPVVELLLGILSIFRRETLIPTEASAKHHVL